MYELCMYEAAVVQQVECWLIRCKARVHIKGQALKTKYKKKLLLRRFPLSRYLAKTRRVNKPAMNKFLKNLSFRFDVKLQVSPLMEHHLPKSGPLLFYCEDLISQGLEVAVVYYEVCWLIRHKAQVRIPGQISKRNMKKKIFLRRFSFSRFLAKTL